MAVTFDNDIVSVEGLDGYDKIICAREINGIVEEILKNGETDFEIFPQNANINDCFYFGWHAGVWHDLTLNIGNPIIATQIDIAWEYWNGSSWSSLPNLSDGTNNFQTSGKNTVSFDIPTNWVNRLIGNLVSLHQNWYIRARIINLNTLSQGCDHNSEQPTGKDYSVMITGIGNTPETIYSSGVAGSLMTKVNEYYFLNCHLRIGDYSTQTEFKIENCYLQVGTNSFPLTIIAQRTKDVWLMGNKTSGAGSGGGLIFYSNSPQAYNYWRCKCYWYNSLIKKPLSGFNNGCYSLGIKVIENCLLSNQSICFFVGLDENSSFKNNILDMGSASFWFYVYTDKLIIDNLTFTRGMGILTTAANIIENVNFGTKLFHSYQTIGGGLLNCQMDDFTTQIKYPMYNNSNVSVWFTLTIKIQDEEGNELSDVNVKIDNNVETLINTTWTGSYNVKTYMKERDSLGAENQYNYNPFKITISKTGYETYFIETSFTNKTDWIITLKKAVDIMLSPTGMHIKADPANITDRELLLN